VDRGYMGKILNVDLSSGSIEEENIPDEIYENFLAGSGLAVRLLYDRIPKDADPLGPDNILGFVTGILTGTGAMMMGRWMAVGKSPLTGGWGDANAGGNFAPAIKKCGYDGIFFKGISEKPVYLKVFHGKAELVDASHLWGKDVVETEHILKDELGKRYKNVRVLCIGPAGENKSLISGIVNDGARIAARSGLGSVMGSKRLKAVALVGNRQVKAMDTEEIKKLSKRFAKWIVSTDSIANRFPARILNFMGRFLRVSPVGFANPGDMAKLAFRSFGTIVTNVMSSEYGDSPVKNWKGAGYKDYPISTHANKINPGIVVKNERRKYHCYSCPLGCGGIMDLEGKTRYDLKETHKPEYETMCVFGTFILNNDIDSIYLINDMVNRAGMDVISAGSTVGFAMECYEQGILTQEQLGDMDLKWGNSEAVIELLQKMIYREGIGDLLADGVKKASERLGKGSEKFAIHAGGQELPMHDSRNDPGWGVCYSMEPTPGRHTKYSYQFIELMAMHKIFKSLPAYPQVFTRKTRNSPRGKEVLLSAASKYCQLNDGAGGCLFGIQMGAYLPIIEYLNAATGWNKTPEQYLEIGERINHLRQAFNVKHGKLPGKDFKLPPRAAGDPPMTYGPLKGVKIPINELNRSFTKAMGWDEMGKPLKDRLMQLGLSDVAEELYSE
jgi:aldehyde:ferredoxin oxidoreductase